MKSSELGWAIFGVVVAQLVIAAATFAWVAGYSTWVSPGRTLGHYQAHAALAGPWLSLGAAVPVYGLVLRGLSRRPALRPRRIALAAWLIAVGLDCTSISASGAASPIHPVLLAAIWLAKAAGCHLGSRSPHPHRA